MEIRIASFDAISEVNMVSLETELIKKTILVLFIT